LIVSDAGGENESVIGMRKDGQTFSKYGLAWAPDGSVIVCAAGRWDHGYHLNLLAFDPKGGAPRLIGTQSWFSVYQIAWQADMSSLVISARERETTPHQLWRVSYPDGDIQKITTDLNEYLGVSLAGNKIVTVQQARSWRLWVADLADLKNARSITTGTGFGYGVTWTKNWNIVYSSMIQDHLNISRIAPDGSKVLLTEVGENYNPAASNDGSFVVFAAKRGGAFNIFRMNTVNGTDLQQLTFTDGNFYPSISPDNQWVAYDNLTDSRATVWKVPVQGGTPVKIAAGYRMPVFSPDGNWIAVRYDEIASQSADLVIYPANGGGPVRTVEIPRLEWQRVYWLDDHTLSFIKSTAGASNIWSLDLDTGVSKQLTSFNSEQIFSYAWSPDLQQVVIQRGGRISNVTIISSEQ
jgi:Tol biopolymer transport system component